MLITYKKMGKNKALDLTEGKLSTPDTLSMWISIIPDRRECG
jgi:hypothetical protein